MLEGLTFAFEPSVEAYEDAEGTIPATNGSPLGLVPDQSSTQTDVAATSTARPAYIAGALNNRAVARFDGVSNVLSRENVLGSTLFSTNAGSMFLLIKQDGTQANNVTFSWRNTNESDVVQVLATYSNIIYFDHGDFGTGGRISVAQPTDWDNTWRLLEVHRDGSSGEILVDGIPLLTGSFTQTPNLSVSKNLNIGYSNPTSPAYFKGDIALIYGYNRSLSSDEREQFRTWATERYDHLNPVDGDVFVVAGQSNNSGRGTNNQSYSHESLVPMLFGNDYIWKTLSDPFDSSTGQVDTVSSDSAAGSYVPLLATLYMSNQGKAPGFVPCAKGGSSITSWLPGANHFDRTTLYGSMAYRARATGSKVVLWWQGETDAIAAMDQATYNSHLDTIANTIYEDLGIKLMACKLQNSSGIADTPNESAINAAIEEAWNDNTNVLEGPDLSDIGSDDAYHLQSDAKLLTAAQRWWAAIETAFYS